MGPIFRLSTSNRSTKFATEAMEVARARPRCWSGPMRIRFSATFRAIVTKEIVTGIRVMPRE